MQKILDASGLNIYTQALKGGQLIVGRAKDSSNADYAKDASTAFYALHSSATGLLGTIPLANLPQGAMEKLVKVANENAMLALTIDVIQDGDSVLTIDNNRMYIVTDDSKLGTIDAFTEYSAGTAVHALQADWATIAGDASTADEATHATSADTATNVEWTGVNNKPTEFKPARHTQDASTITKLTGYQEAASASAVTADDTLLIALGKIEKKANDVVTSYESLSDKMDNLMKNSPLVSLSVAPTTIFVGDSSTLVFSANIKDTASSIIIIDDNGTQIASGSGTSLDGSTAVTPSSEGVLGYSVIAVVDGTTLSAKSYVNCVRQIYYGSGTNYTDATIVADAKQTPNGKYTISVDAANNYIYFVVPSSMTITKVLMNGLNMPMQATSVQKDDQSYTAYQSVNGYDVGTYTLDVE